MRTVIGVRVRERERMGEGGTSGFCRRSGSKCGRWNPTAEQLKLLSQLFASGLRTPSTGQIRKISALLSFYGHVESKNVFYWFQNHKARERRKLTPPPPSSSPMFYSDTDNRVVPEPERVMETLQLFPVGESSSEAGELRMHAHCRDDTAEPVEPPPLDLRLSFL